MLIIQLLILCFSSMDTQTIFDFTSSSTLTNWYVVDDGVMGGRSAGQLTISEDGYGVFEGDVSLENNGGFSSIRYDVNKMNVSGYTKLKLRVKGDGKNYQVRIKNTYRDYHSYVKTISTTEKWQDIEIKLSDMYPTFRGRTLDMENFSHEFIEEFAILVGNKKAEKFKLLIDKIEII